MLKRFLIALPLVLLALVLIDRASLVSAPCITAVGNQANERDNGKEERCTKREGIVVAGLETPKDIPAEWFTAFASIAIALFTFTLWRSTDRLWKAGESQIDIARSPPTLPKRWRMQLSSRRKLSLLPAKTGKSQLPRLVCGMPKELTK